MYDVKIGEKIFENVHSIKLNTVDGGTAQFTTQENLKPSYVVGAPVEFILSAVSWDGSTYTIDLTSDESPKYILGEYGAQLGLPSVSSSVNTQTAVEAALTLPSVSVNSDTGYITYIYISAVNIPTADITIALFGLEATTSTEEVVA